MIRAFIENIEYLVFNVCGDITSFIKTITILFATFFVTYVIFLIFIDKGFYGRKIRWKRNISGSIVGSIMLIFYILWLDCFKTGIKAHLPIIIYVLIYILIIAYNYNKKRKREGEMEHDSI